MRYVIFLLVALSSLHGSDFELDLGSLIHVRNIQQGWVLPTLLLAQKSEESHLDMSGDASNSDLSVRSEHHEYKRGNDGYASWKALLENPQLQEALNQPDAEWDEKSFSKKRARLSEENEVKK